MESFDVAVAFRLVIRRLPVCDADTAFVSINLVEVNCVTFSVVIDARKR